jgi:hypothetical protein
VKDSERRSAEAIGQIGEQVARVADRLQTQHAESLRAFETRLADSGRSYETKLETSYLKCSGAWKVGDQSPRSWRQCEDNVISLPAASKAEDARRDDAAPAVTRDIPIVTDEYVILDDEPAKRSRMSAR